MQKVVTHLYGKSPITDFKANVKQNYAPQIEESYVDESGNIQHILSNGNTLSELYYIKIWGQPKGIIKPKGYKGENKDTTKF